MDGIGNGDNEGGRKEFRPLPSASAAEQESGSCVRVASVVMAVQAVSA
jgi:hypothetical protein